LTDANMTTYKLLEKYILRSPVYPLVESDQNFGSLSFFKDKCDFLNRVAIASPQLYNEYQRWADFGGKTVKEEKKIFLGLAKYYVRMSMRSTPFGLFSGLVVGNIKDKTDIKVCEKDSHNPVARLDMHILDSLLNDIQKDNQVKKELFYYPNDSLYRIGERYNFFESYSVDGNKKFEISSVDYNIYLEKVISKANTGVEFSVLVDCLLDDDISSEMAIGFIENLIDNQILISNLQPGVTGGDLLNRTINKIESIESIKPISKILKSVSQQLQEFKNNNISDAYRRTSEICNQIKSIHNSVNEQYVCNFDLVLKTQSNCLDQGIEDDLRKALSILNRLTPFTKKSEIERFKEVFYSRYDQQMIPLLKVFDFNNGIKYPLNSPFSFTDNSPLIDDLKISKLKPNDRVSVSWSKLESLLLKKYVESVKYSQLECEFKEEDLSKFKENWDDLPSTFAVKTKIVEIKGKRWLLIDSVSGDSAINLISRFAHADKKIENLVLDIAENEKEILKDEILAEIVHLPDNRDGNVISRTSFRDYEITFLTQASVDSKHSLPVSDLQLKLDHDQLILWSEKLNRRVTPYLSCAHNYNYKSMPIYKFLCDIQTQGIRRFLHFDWGILGSEMTFLPRVTYKNIILSLAMWHVHSKDILDLISESDSVETMNRVTKFRKENNIPEKVVLVQGDNELLIDLCKINSIDILISSIKKYPLVELKEFLFELGDSPVVNNNGDQFANEFIFSFCKN